MEDWELYLSPDDFAAIKSDPRLAAIIAVGRVANAISLIIPALTQVGDPDSPKIRREKTAALFYSSAVLHEGLRVAETLGAHFRHMPEFVPFRSLLSDPDLVELRRLLLKPLRDKAVFHFDADLSKSISGLTSSEDVILVSGRGNTAGEVYFDISDTVIVYHILGLQPETDKSMWVDMTQRMMRAGALATRYLIAAHTLLPAALREIGVKQRKRPSATD